MPVVQAEKTNSRTTFILLAVGFGLCIVGIVLGFTLEVPNIVPWIFVALASTFLIAMVYFAIILDDFATAAIPQLTEKYRCPHCGRRFTKKEDVANHVASCKFNDNAKRDTMQLDDNAYESAVTEHKPKYLVQWNEMVAARKSDTTGRSSGDPYSPRTGAVEAPTTVHPPSEAFAVEN